MDYEKIADEILEQICSKRYVNEDCTMYSLELDVTKLAMFLAKTNPTPNTYKHSKE
jgi:hypothetical protein